MAAPAARGAPGGRASGGRGQELSGDHLNFVAELPVDDPPHPVLGLARPKIITAHDDQVDVPVKGRRLRCWLHVPAVAAVAAVA